jgi:hypothetical protein
MRVGSAEFGRYWHRGRKLAIVKSDMPAPEALGGFYLHFFSKEK